MKIANLTQKVTTVSSSLTTLNDQSSIADGGEPTGGLRDAEWYDIANAGAALTDLQVQFQFYSGGPWRTVLSVADWTNILAGTQAVPAFLLGVSTTNPGALADGASTWFGIAPAGIYAHRLQAKCNSSTIVTVNGSGAEDVKNAESRGGEELVGLGTTRDRIRTCDLRFRKPALYPTELRGRVA